MILEKEFVMRLINNPMNLGRTAIKPSDIGVPAYRDAYKELTKQLSQGHTPDIYTIMTSLPDHIPLLSEMNGIEKANFEYYEKKLAKDIQRRRLAFASEYLTDSLKAGVDPSEIISEVEHHISRSWVSIDRKEIEKLYDVALGFGPILEERVKNRGKIVGVTTGFDTLDGYTGGFQPGTYYIGARPSQGKTAMMLTMMRAAMAEDHSVGLISIESSKNDLIARIISAQGNVDASALRTGSMKKSDYGKLTIAYEWLKTKNGIIYANTKTDISMLEATARTMVKTHGVEIIYIDYLQRIYAKGNTKFEQVAAASRAITDIAKGLGVPVVCLVQTGRTADKEAPSLNHFQYSSAIEQDADVAMIINPPDPAGMSEEGKLCILKNRDGETGDVDIVFNRSKVFFYEPVKR